MKNLHLKNLLNLKVILDQFIKKQTDIFSRVGIAFAYTIFGNNFIPYFWAMYFTELAFWFVGFANGIVWLSDQEKAKKN